MRYLWQHAFQIIDAYRGELPLHHFLKQYFRRHPKLGSRDRRALGDIAYSWYRCSKAFDLAAHSREDLIPAALFLCGLRPKALDKIFLESWPLPGGLSIADRLEVLLASGFQADLNRIFPYPAPFSDGITTGDWQRSLLQQPHLFLRVRKDRDKVARLLKEADIPYDWLSDTCLALPNGSPVDGLLPPDTYVVQDASSQATGHFFHPTAGEAWWDCCAGAGGKSLLLKDLRPEAPLTVSDVRDSILHNLVQRFRQYRLTPPQAITLDAGDAALTAQKMGSRLFDAIICDVPCSGSGTWARTPEQAYFFRPEQLTDYSRRQTAILRNVSKRVTPGGRILYITCSVFREENEAVIEAAAAEGLVDIRSRQLLNGIGKGADCLFLAELTGR